MKEISSRRERVRETLGRRLKRLRIRPKRILPWLGVVGLFFAAGGGYWLYRTNRLREALPPQGALSLQSAPQREGLQNQLLLMEVAARLASLPGRGGGQARPVATRGRLQHDVQRSLERLYGSSGAWAELEATLTGQPRSPAPRQRPRRPGHFGLSLPAFWSATPSDP